LLMMSKISEKFEVQGDKKNSDFFREYLPKIYDRREKSGIDDLVEGLSAVVIQVEYGEAIKYLIEIYLMTPYRFSEGYISQTHKVFVLRNRDGYPSVIVLEPLDKNYFSKLSGIDVLYARAKEKPNARYMGEIYKTKNLKETVGILEEQEFRFLVPENMVNRFLANENFRLSDISYFTNNLVGYSESDLDSLVGLGVGESFVPEREEQLQLDKVDEVYKAFGFDKLIQGIDHMATRVLCHDRESAILELLSMTNYYFWGAYTIEEMNSSTNICRNPNIEDELLSPAKVFTANNTPFYTKTIDGLPSPTEDFVRNFGKRMHHMAYAIADGEQEGGVKNIDYVVGELYKKEVPFLADVIGECKDFPDLKQIFSKSSSLSFLITEYVQRCHGFEGFFTKDNVASLTEAAGADEALQKADVCD